MVISGEGASSINGEKKSKAAAKSDGGEEINSMASAWRAIENSIHQRIGGNDWRVTQAAAAKISKSSEKAKKAARRKASKWRQNKGV